MKALDLGCGTNPRTPDGYEGFGVDIVDVGLPNVKVADLALEPIPYEDNSFELCTAYDFVEHIPMVLYIPETLSATGLKGMIPNGAQLIKRNCMIELFNEIYRVLKDNGEFSCQVPCYPSQAVFQDPTHVSFWTPENVHYFSGDYYGFSQHYGHTSRFEKLESYIIGSHLHFRLRAIKSLPKEHPYLLKY